MKKWRGISALLLISVLLFTGCTNPVTGILRSLFGDDPVIEDVEPEPDPEPEVDPEPADDSNVVSLSIIADHYYSYLTGDAYSIDVRSSAYSLSDDLKDEYSELNDALEQIKESTTSEYREHIDEIENALPTYSEQHPTGLDYYADMQAGDFTTVMRADSVVYSQITYEKSISAGSSGDSDIYTNFKAYNLDSQTGEQIELTDVVSDLDKFIEIVENQFDEDYAGIYDDLSNKDGYFENAADYFNNNWVITNEGINVYIHPYLLVEDDSEISANEKIIVTVLFDEAPELFNVKYTDVPRNHVLRMDGSDSTYLNIDGKRTKVSVEYTSESEYDQYKEYAVVIGDKKVDLEAAFEGYEAVIMCMNGKYYLYINVSYDSGSSIAVVDLQTAKETVDSMFFRSFLGRDLGIEDQTYSDYGSSYEIINNPDDFYISLTSEILSSYSVTGRFKVGEDGNPESISLPFEVDSNPILRLETDLEVKTVEDGKTSGDDELSSGTYLKIVATDCESYVDVCIVDEDDIEPTDYDTYLLKDGVEIPSDAKVYRIEVERVNYSNKVNGMDETDVFSGQMYAG